MKSSLSHFIILVYIFCSSCLPLGAYAPSTIVEINTEGITVYPFGTYLSYIRTQDGRIYGIEELEPFQKMKWQVGEAVDIASVNQVIHGLQFKNSKVLLDLHNLDANETAVVILLRHPTSKYLQASIRDNEEEENDEINNIKLNDGRVYEVIDVSNYYVEDWLPGDAVEENGIVRIGVIDDEMKPIALLHNLSQDKDIEVFLRD